MKQVILLLSLLGCSLQTYAQWKRIYIPTVKDLFDVQILGNVCYAAGNNSAVLKSYDTGKSWKNIVLTLPSDTRALYFLDSNIGFVTGENAKIQKTINGGKNWSQKYIRTAAYGYDIVFQNNNGIMVGKDMLAISSVDYGENWTVDTTISEFRKLNSVTILPNGNCWAVGDSGFILHKKLTAKKWNVIKYPTKVDLNHVSHVDNRTLIITGGMPDSAIVGKYYNILLMSNDSGKTWQQTNVSEMKIINSASYLNKDTGYLVGSSGLISKCNDGIADRSLQLTGISSGLNEIAFSGNIGIVVGDGGTLLRTANGGGWRLTSGKLSDTPHSLTCNPNPCYQSFELNANAEINEVSIFNSEGKRIYSGFGHHLNGLSVEMGAPGIYHIIVKFSDGFSLSRKLVVQANN